MPEQPAFESFAAKLQLLVDKFDRLANRDGTEFSGESANAFIFGISELARLTQSRLEGAVNTVFAATHPKAPEVAS